MRLSVPKMARAVVLAALVAVMWLDGAAPAQELFDGGRSSAHITGHVVTLGNRAISARWSTNGERFGGLEITDPAGRRTVQIPYAFRLLMKDGTVFRPENMRIQPNSAFHPLSVNPKAARLADQVGGWEWRATLADDNGIVQVDYAIVLRDGSQYIRQVLTITAEKADAAIREVRLIDLSLPDAEKKGTVRGSPIVDGNFFFGFEHPLSQTDVVRGRATAGLSRKLPIPRGQSVTYSSVIGVAPAGQMRRAFLAYIERERAHPYRTFLHYNSWLDLGAFTPYDEAAALDSVNTFGEELHQKRGVVLDSYLFDDGWDEHSSLWSFHSGFPRGFSNVRSTAEKYGAEPGVWMSPWGGYSKPKQERIQFGKQAGYEIVDNGFALSGPKYYERFRDVCLEMIRKYGINQFKFDGTGNADRVVPGSRFDSDFDAAIHLIGELRAAKPDLYVNLTTGTFASPFWLMYADSIWRGGEDSDYAGVGTDREKWITYRDADTYAGVVSKGPLFPLNSLMLHGIIYAKSERHLNTDPGNDFTNEVRSYFGTGTQLQEMYITHSLMKPANWDALAEAAKWSRSNADVLKDTHWVGGDPAWLEIYGWASWLPKKAILVLRNPSDQTQIVTLDLAKVLELPTGAVKQFEAKSPWKEDEGKPARLLDATRPQKFELKAFEVLTLDLTPKK